jgi:hypothetical protein
MFNRFPQLSFIGKLQTACDLLDSVIEDETEFKDLPQEWRDKIFNINFHLFCVTSWIMDEEKRKTER